jgi:Uma2 family endonuclease
MSPTRASLVTRAAEGLPRRGFHVADVERMVACGLIGSDERLELIGGELVPMSPKGVRHEAVKRAVLRGWGRLDAHDCLVETTFRLGETTFLEPDILVIGRDVRLAMLSGREVALAVEIADSSLGYDLGRKPALYAEAGVAELWVIDANRLVLHRHREPFGAAYRDVEPLPADVVATPRAAPELALRLADLEILD